MTNISDITIIGSVASLILSLAILIPATLQTFKTSKRYLISGLISFVLILWLFTAYKLAKIDFFKVSVNSVFPNIVFTFTPLIAGVLLLKYSKTIGQIRKNISQPFLIGIQTYRTLGVAFLLLWLKGELPAEFAIPAGLGDILIGVSALFVGYFSYKNAQSTRLIKYWNVLGILDLVLAVTLGFLSSPGIAHIIATEDPNILISSYPLVLVPAFGVPLSILLHILSLQKIQEKKDSLSFNDKKTTNMIGLNE